MALYPVPNHADDAANLVSSPEGRAQRHPGDDQDGSPRLAGLADPGPLHLQPRGPRPAVPDPVAQPARVRRGRARRGPPVLGVGVADVGPDVPRDAVRAERARSRQRAAERRRRPVRGARHHAAAVRPVRRPGLSHDRRARLRDARRRHQPAGAPADPHPAPLRDAGPRPRPSPRQDRRRAAALPVGRLQPPVLARPGRLHRRVHRPSGRRHAARLPDHHAARRQRQPAGAAHLVGERVRAGRLARLVAPDDQRRAALRVQRAAGGRRRSHGRLRPGHAVGAAGGAERRAALRPRLGLQQLRAARRRQLGSHRPRHAGDARRLRPLLRQRHADRELGALLQPAVLAAAALLPERAGPDLDRRSVPDRHRRSDRADDQHASPAGSAPATRSRRASAWSARSPRSR